MQWFWRHYLGDDDQPLPPQPDLTGLPKCFVLAAELDCLLDDARDLANMLTTANVQSQFHVASGAVHGFLHFSSGAKVAMDAHRLIAEFVRTCG